ncbi:MAG: 30S ribosomal protein S20 [Chlorobi bacterium]|nr:30S ribosomal protein S20 [Chlorobiota bacterium]
MPQHKSAEKRVRQSAKRRAYNGFQKVKMRRAIKAVRQAENKEEAIAKSREAQQILDRLATKGIIHKNFAANRKSQFARLIANFDNA